MGNSCVLLVSCNLYIHVHVRCILYQYLPVHFPWPRHGRIFTWIYNIYRVKLIFDQRLKVVIKCDGYKFMLFASRHYLYFEFLTIVFKVYYFWCCGCRSESHRWNICVLVHGFHHVNQMLGCDHWSLKIVINFLCQITNLHFYATRNS